jgi:hypothetical protein
MTTLSRSKSRIGRHTLAVAVLAIIAVAGADWAKGIDVASLRVLQVEQPF